MGGQPDQVRILGPFGVRGFQSIDHTSHRVTTSPDQFDFCQPRRPRSAPAQFGKQLLGGSLEHVKASETTSAGRVLSPNHQQVTAVDRRTLVVSHVSQRHEDIAASPHRNTDRTGGVEAFEQHVFGGLERRPVAANHRPCHRSTPPASQQQVASISFRQSGFIVVRLAHRNPSAHVLDHRPEQVGAVGGLCRHPPPRPSEVGPGRDVQQAAGNVIQGQAFVVVVVCEQVPAAVKHQPATVPRSTGHHLQITAVGTAPQHAADSRVGDLRPLGLAEERPVPPVIGATEVTVEDQHVTQRQVEVTVGPPGQSVETLVRMIVGVSPDQPLGLDSVPFRDSPGQKVQRAVGHRVKIIAADLEIVDPRVGREPKNLLPFAQPTGCRCVIRLVDENRFSSPDEQSPRRIGSHRQKRFTRRTVDRNDLQRGVGQAVLDTGGRDGRPNESEHQQNCQPAAAKWLAAQQHYGHISIGVIGAGPEQSVTGLKNCSAHWNRSENNSASRMTKRSWIGIPDSLARSRCPFQTTREAR